jgi:hypothetical protein
MGGHYTGGGHFLMALGIVQASASGTAGVGGRSPTPA